MILLAVPVTVVVICLMVRSWRVTVPLLTVVGLAALTYWVTPLGWMVIGFIGLVAIPVLWSQHRDREIGRLRAER